MSILWLLLLALFAVGAKGSDFSLAIIPKSIVVTFGETPSIRVEANGYLPVPIRVHLAQQKEVQVLPNETLTFSEGMHNDSVEVLLHPIRQGRFIIQPVIEPPRVVDGSRFFLLMKVAMYEPLIIVSLLIGWTYTACWSAGYYPQIWYNYRQKSVVGLSFDYLYINIVGHISYVIFNAFLYWNSYIEEEYYRRHPLGLNPVILNDIGFAAHAVFGTGFTILQCRWYYTGGNTVSKPAKVIIGLFLVLIVVSMSMAWLRYIHWLDFLYVLSYIKLLTTMVKYFPQAYMNYCRKSTTGFPILNRLMDLAGGLFGILQMIINAWNFDDWTSIGGDPVKFGLGIFSIVFDFVFMFQHYVLYRKSKPKPEQVNLPILQSHVKTVTAEE